MKREILSLVSLLQHASKVVRPDPNFVARMYATAAKVSQLDFYTMASGQIHSGSTPFRNTGIGTVSFAWHHKTFDKFLDAYKKHGVVGPFLTYSGNGQKNGVLLT